MEVIDGPDDPGADPVQIAFADTREEAGLVRGLLSEAGIPSMARGASIDGQTIGEGLLTWSNQRIYARRDDAEGARALLRVTMVEEPAEIPEPVNARHLAGDRPTERGAGPGGRVRNYSVLGAYARSYLVAILVGGLALAVFLVLKG